MSTNTASLISSIYTSRKNVLALMKRQGYDVTDYKNFSVNEVNTMFQNNQLDMLLETKNHEPSEKPRKIYIRYYLGKIIRPANIHEMIDDLFHVEQILTKDDTLFIITKDVLNDTNTSELKHIWEKDGIFLVVQSIKGLQFNILEHVLVPDHRAIDEKETEFIMKKYNIQEKTKFPDISRFDPVAQAIGLRPGNVCEITRPSKSAILAKYYRICINL
jgi:DNA-directed RNA polymerase subunit H (RpoH/RPB5)